MHLQGAIYYSNGTVQQLGPWEIPDVYRDYMKQWLEGVGLNPGVDLVVCSHKIEMPGDLAWTATGKVTGWYG